MQHWLPSKGNSLGYRCNPVPWEKEQVTTSLCHTLVMPEMSFFRQFRPFYGLADMPRYVPMNSLWPVVLVCYQMCISHQSWKHGSIHIMSSHQEVYNSLEMFCCLKGLKQVSRCMLILYLCSWEDPCPILAITPVCKYVSFWIPMQL